MNGRRRGQYGLACQTCAKAKVRCDPVPKDKCKRCQRLEKPCNPPHGVRKYGPQKLYPEIRDIQSKIDDVLSLLKSAGQCLPAEIAAPQPFTQTTPSQPIPAPAPELLQVQQVPQLLQPSQLLQVPHLPQVSQVQQLQQPSSMPSIWTRNGEEALTMFRDHFLRFFPFVYLRPDLSAQQLQVERPFFWEAVLAVTSRSVQEKIDRAHNIKSALATAMIVESRPNLDLLLGALTYAAWAQEQFVLRIHTPAIFMGLAVTLVNYLHWNKPKSRDEHMVINLGGEHFFQKEEHQPCSIEAKRAVLGCYLMSSFVSIYFSRSDTMPWTRQMEEYLQTLETNREWWGDAALAIHVRLQRVVENARQARDQHQTLPVISVFVRSFMSELQDVRKSIPPELAEDGKSADLILAHVHYVDLSIHETAYTANYTPDGSDARIGPDAVNCMRQSLQAIQSWIKVYSQLRPEDHLGFTIAMWDQLARSFVTLHRLSKHPALDWDREAVLKTINVANVVDHLSKTIQKISPPAGGPFPDDMWSRIGLLTSAIRAWLCTELRITEKEGTEGWDQPNAHAGAGLAVPMPTAMSSTHAYTGMPHPDYSSAAWFQFPGLMPNNPMGDSMDQAFRVVDHSSRELAATYAAGGHAVLNYSV